MARKTKEIKRIEALTEAIYRTHGDGVQVPIMSLGKIFTAGTNAALAGGTDLAVEEAMKAEIARVRVN